MNDHTDVDALPHLQKRDPNGTPLVVGVHGFNTNGLHIHDLQSYFTRAGFDWYTYVYGKRWITSLGNLIANRFRTKDVQAGLINALRMTDRNVILVGHSHGLYLSWLAHQHCANVVGVIGINGCLQAGTAFGKHVWVINCYCPTDWTLKLGGKYRPFSKWGDYGAKPNLGAHNVDLSDWGVKGHSDVFNDLNKIGPYIADKAKALYAAQTTNAV